MRTLPIDFVFSMDRLKALSTALALLGTAGCVVSTTATDAGIDCSNFYGPTPIYEQGCQAPSICPTAGCGRDTSRYVCYCDGTIRYASTCWETSRWAYVWTGDPAATTCDPNARP